MKRSSEDIASDGEGMSTESSETHEKNKSSDGDPLNVLPEICKDRILSNMNFKTMMNTITAYSSMIDSAYRVFQKHFNNKMIIYSDDSYDQYYEDAWAERIGIKFERIFDENQFLLALENFGPHIRALGVTVTKKSTLNKIIEKCSNSLRELVILPDGKNLVLHADFPNLRKLAFVMGNHDLDDSWVKFKKKFPKLFCLEFHDRMGVGFRFKNSYVQRIPKLSKFIYHLSKVSFENIQNISDFINQNKQMISLSLYGSTGLDKLQSLIEWDQMKVKRLKIMSNNKINIACAYKINSLESLTLMGDKYDEINLYNTSEIPKLEIHVWGRTIPWVAAAFPNIQELTMRIGFGMKKKKGVFRNLDCLIEGLDQLKVVKFAVCETDFCEFSNHIFVGMMRSSFVSRQLKVVLEVDSTVPSGTQDFSSFDWKKYRDNAFGLWTFERKRFRDLLTGTKLTVIAMNELMDDQEI